jgi:hypothetical protein
MHVADRSLRCWWNGLSRPQPGRGPRRTSFDKDADYLAFERVLEETLRTRPMRVCA